ncbi:unnamed protein product, partial [Mesorhabditis spiculigera]
MQYRSLVAESRDQRRRKREDDVAVVHDDYGVIRSVRPDNGFQGGPKVGDILLETSYAQNRTNTFAPPFVWTWEAAKKKSRDEILELLAKTATTLMEIAEPECVCCKEGPVKRSEGALRLCLDCDRTVFGWTGQRNRCDVRQPYHHLNKTNPYARLIGRCAECKVVRAAFYGYKPRNEAVRKILGITDAPKDDTGTARELPDASAAGAQRKKK